jgi:hypothetical protein
MILLDYLGYIGSRISSALVIRTKHCFSKESEQLDEIQGMEKQIMAHGRRQNLKSLRQDLIQLYYKSSSLIHFRRTVLTSSGSNALSDVCGIPSRSSIFYSSIDPTTIQQKLHCESYKYVYNDSSLTYAYERLFVPIP